MAKPSKRKWAVEKRKQRVLARQAKAKKVADRLLGKKLIGVSNSSGRWQYEYQYRNSKTGATTEPTKI